jgi:hypothetical protein
MEIVMKKPKKLTDADIRKLKVEDGKRDSSLILANRGSALESTPAVA